MLLTADSETLRGVILRAAGTATELDELDAESLLAGAGLMSVVGSLLSDPDPVVRTGATLLLGRLGPDVSAGRITEAMVLAWRGLVDQAPVGFDGAWARTLWGHGLLVLAERVGPDDLATADLVAEWADHVELRGPLLVRLARSVPDLVCRESRRWATPDDSGVVVALPDHAHRVAYVACLAPWPVRAIPPVVEGLTAIGVLDVEVDELVVVMLGRPR